MSTKKRLPASERRRLVMAAATELFAEHGYGNVTLDDVAQAAGVTKPIVYRHFASKQELHMALLAHHRDGLLATLATSSSTPLPLAQRVPLVAERWLSFVREHRYAALMLFVDTTGVPEVRAFHEEMRDAARATLAALIRADTELTMPDDQVEPTAELLRAGMAGLAVWSARRPDVPDEVLVAAVASLYTTGLARPAGRPQPRA